MAVATSKPRACSTGATSLTSPPPLPTGSTMGFIPDSFQIPTRDGISRGPTGFPGWMENTLSKDICREPMLVSWRWQGLPWRWTACFLVPPLVDSAKPKLPPRVASSNWTSKSNNWSRAPGLAVPFPRRRQPSPSADQTISVPPGPSVRMLRVRPLRSGKTASHGSFCLHRYLAKVVFPDWK